MHPRATMPAAAGILLSFTGYASADEYLVELSPVEETFLEWASSGHCRPDDVADSPARAYVDATGRLQFFAGHYEMFRMSGFNFFDLKRDCTQPVFKSHFDPIPNKCDHFEWLMSTYTTDGITVHGLVHMEYHGWEDGGPYASICPEFVALPDASAAKNYRCQWDAVTQVKSVDGGSFTHPVPTADAAVHVVARSAYDFNPLAQVHAEGFSGPKNILYREGAYYTFVEALPHNHGDAGADAQVQEAGTIALRTSTLDDPSSWRCWNGQDYSSKPGKDACKVVAPHTYQVTFNSYMKRPLAVGAAGPGNPGFYYSTADSGTLTSWPWSSFRLLFNTPLYELRGGPEWRAYASFLQPGDPTRNFEQTGRSPYVYYTYQSEAMHTIDYHNRDIRRRRVRFYNADNSDKDTYDVLSLEMNEHGGSKTLDSSFYGNNGDLAGVSWSDERATGPKALSFNGSGQLVVPEKTDSHLTLTSAITIEAFVKLPAVPTNTFAVIVSKEDSSSRNYGLYVPPSGSPNNCEGKLHFSYGVSPAYSGSCGKTQIADDKWHHVAVVFSNSNKTAVYYVDGVQDGTAVHTQDFSATTNTAQVLIGKNFVGLLDSVRIFNHSRESKILEDSTGSGNVELCNGVDDDGDKLPDNGLPCVRGATESESCPGSTEQRTRVCRTGCVWSDWTLCPPLPEAGADVDAGEDGCGCRAAGARVGERRTFGAIVLGVLLAVRRRRKVGQGSAHRRERA